MRNEKQIAAGDECDVRRLTIELADLPGGAGAAAGRDGVAHDVDAILKGIRGIHRAVECGGDVIQKLRVGRDPQEILPAAMSMPITSSMSTTNSVPRYARRPSRGLVVT